MNSLYTEAHQQSLANCCRHTQHAAGACQSHAYLTLYQVVLLQLVCQVFKLKKVSQLRCQDKIDPTEYCYSYCYMVQGKPGHP